MAACESLIFPVSSVNEVARHPYSTRDCLILLIFQDRRTGRGARGAAATPKFGQLKFCGQQEKIWVKPVLKDVSMFFIIIIVLKR